MGDRYIDYNTLPFTEWLARSISLAEPPMNPRDSFGGLRTRLVHQALQECEGRQDLFHDRLAALFGENGIDPLNPSNNL